MTDEPLKPARLPDIFVWAVFPLADLRTLIEPGAPLVMRPWEDASQDRFLRRFGPVHYSKDDRSAGAVPVARHWSMTPSIAR